MAAKRPSRFHTAKAPPVKKISFIKIEGVATTLFLQAKKYNTNKRINPLRKMFRGAIATSIARVEYINETISNKPASQFIILSRPVGIDKAFRLAVLVSFTFPLLVVVLIFFLVIFEN